MSFSLLKPSWSARYSLFFYHSFSNSNNKIMEVCMEVILEDMDMDQVLDTLQSMEDTHIRWCHFICSCWIDYWLSFRANNSKIATAWDMEVKDFLEFLKLVVIIAFRLSFIFRLRISWTRLHRKQIRLWGWGTFFKPTTSNPMTAILVIRCTNLWFFAIFLDIASFSNKWVLFLTEQKLSKA